ncbi:MAG: hypothetical protein ACKVIO_06175 [Phycisphaerales bacterium]
MTFYAVVVSFLCENVTIAVVNIAFSDVRFDVEVQYESGGNSTGVCTGDFDNDGDLVVALANRSSDSITVLYNDFI